MGQGCDRGAQPTAGGWQKWIKQQTQKGGQPGQSPGERAGLEARPAPAPNAWLGEGPKVNSSAPPSVHQASHVPETLCLTRERASHPYETGDRLLFWEGWAAQAKP